MQTDVNPDIYPNTQGWTIKGIAGTGMFEIVAMGNADSTTSGNYRRLEGKFSSMRKAQNRLFNYLEKNRQGDARSMAIKAAKKDKGYEKQQETRIKNKRAGGIFSKKPDAVEDTITE